MKILESIGVNLAKAIIAVMQEVEGIEKSMTVGSGQSSYQGVPDKEVKRIIGALMTKNGLTILPIGVEPKTEISRWEEQTQYGTKQKQSVFTEVRTKYLLLHESGENAILEGYGQGVDTQDKGAGKATTYALKYTLLYTFLVPTGKIDDSDNQHSDQHETPKNNKESFLLWTDAVNGQQTIPDLTALYTSNKATVDGDKNIMALFTKRRKELETTKS